MEKTDLNYIRDFIIMGKPREALEEILNILQRSSRLQVRLRDDVILIRVQYAELERKENLNLISPDEANRERAQLQKAMLDVINSMEEPFEKPVLLNSITKPASKMPKWALPVALAVVLAVTGIIFGGKIIHSKSDSTSTVQETENLGKEVDRTTAVTEQQPQYPPTEETDRSRTDQTPRETGASQGRITAKPANLTLANWVFEPDPPVQKEPTRITFVVKNTGETDATNFKVEWWAGVNFPQPEKIWTLSLRAGEQQRLSHVYQGYTSWYGRLETKVVIDTEHAVQDADRSDNELVRTISVTKKADEPPPAPAKPDLRIVRIDFAPYPPIKGQTTRVEVGITNQGEAPARNFTVEWWAGVNYPRPEKTWTAVNIEPGAGSTLTFMYQGYPSWYGSLQTKAVADPAGQLDDLNRSNNELIRTISVNKPPDNTPAKPDLRFSSLRFVPEVPVQGQRTQVEVTIENKGNAPASNIEVEWWAGVNYPGPEKTWTGITLQAGEKKNISFVYTGYPSWYGRIETKLVADPRRRIEDSNRSNNELIRAISVRKPSG